MNRTLFRAAAFILLLLVASAATAQPVRTVPLLKAEGLKKVIVLDMTGVEHRGEFVRVDVNELVVVVQNDERTFKRSEIARVVKVGDSRKTGAAIGALGGLAVGIVTVLKTKCGLGNSCAGGLVDRAGLVLINTAMYGAVGFCVDAMVQGRSVIYEAPATTPTRRQVGLQVTVRW